MSYKYEKSLEKIIMDIHYENVSLKDKISKLQIEIIVKDLKISEYKNSI